MQKFRSPGGCQRFVSVFSTVRNLFVPPASNDNALSRYIFRVQAFSPMEKRDLSGYLNPLKVSYIQITSVNMTSPALDMVCFDETVIHAHQKAAGAAKKGATESDQEPVRVLAAHMVASDQQSAWHRMGTEKLWLLLFLLARLMSCRRPVSFLINCPGFQPIYFVTEDMPHINSEKCFNSISAPLSFLPNDGNSLSTAHNRYTETDIWWKISGQGSRNGEQ